MRAATAEVRDRLLTLASADPAVVGAALTGSAAGALRADEAGSAPRPGLDSLRNRLQCGCRGAS
jgi:hypothetical protein